MKQPSVSLVWQEIISCGIPLSILWRISGVPKLFSVVTFKPSAQRISAQAPQQPVCPGTQAEMQPPDQETEFLQDPVQSAGRSGWFRG